jgi:hypothetical protein
MAATNSVARPIIAVKLRGPSRPVMKITPAYYAMRCISSDSSPAHHPLGSQRRGIKTMLVLTQRVALMFSITLAAAFYAAGQSVDHRATTNQHTSSSTPVAPTSDSVVATRAAFSAREFGRSDQRDENHNSFGASLFQESKTPFVTQSTMPLVRPFGTRLQMNFVMTSTNHRNMMNGPLVPSQTTLASAQARTDDSYGLSLNIPLGRGAQSEGSRGLWRGISQVLHRR